MLETSLFRMKQPTYLLLFLFFNNISFKKSDYKGNNLRNKVKHKENLDYL